MTPYSMGLRKRVLKAWDAGLDADSVAAKYEVSRAWVHRLIQRRRWYAWLPFRDVRHYVFLDECGNRRR
jgi:transposase